MNAVGWVSLFVFYVIAQGSWIIASRLLDQNIALRQERDELRAEVSTQARVIASCMRTISAQVAAGNVPAARMDKTAHLN